MCRYVLHKGEVEVLIHDGTVIKTMRDGSHFGEIAMLNDVPRTSSVRAVRNSRCIIDLCLPPAVHKSRQ